MSPKRHHVSLKIRTRGYVSRFQAFVNQHNIGLTEEEAQGLYQYILNKN